MDQSNPTLEFLRAIKGTKYQTQPEILSCKICGSKRLMALEYPSTISMFFANMSLVTCPDCGVSYVPTRPKGLLYYYEKVYSLDRGRTVNLPPEEVFSGKYDQYIAPDRSRHHIALMRERISSLRSIVDFGAGYGATLAVSDAEMKVAVEVDRSMLPYLSHFGIEVVREADELAGRKFDAVMSSHYLEHLYIDDVLETVKAMVALIDRGGVGLIEVPNAPLVYLDLTKNPHYSHVVFFSAEAMRRVIESAGGKIIYTETRGVLKNLRQNSPYQPAEKDDLRQAVMLFLFRSGS